MIAIILFPSFFLDKKPIFHNGGKDGFCQWLISNLEPIKAQLSGTRHRVLITFIVDNTGKVVNPEIRLGFSEMTNRMICNILQESSPWSPGELNGNTIDSRVSILVNINDDGTIMDINMIGY